MAAAGIVNQVAIYNTCYTPVSDETVPVVVAAAVDAATVVVVVVIE